MHLFDLLFPVRCLGCGRFGKYFCDQCRTTIKYIDTSETICPVCERPAMLGATHPRCRTKYTLDGLTSFFHYKGIIRTAIKAIKYRYVSHLSDEFASLVPKSFFDKLHVPLFSDTILVPIPLHVTRLRTRGFNQAEVIGRLIARNIDIPMKADILKRTKKTIPQVEMKDRHTRLKNMEGVFSLTSGSLVSRSLGIVLFDDVFTTGATMRAAASVLKHAGVQYVWAFTMAR